MTKRSSRRWWLGTVARGAGAVALTPWPGPAAIVETPAPGRQLATAVIGCGGRGEASLAAALGERLVALVDVDAGRLAAAAAKAAAQGAKPRTFFDYRTMFDEMHREIDAVFVATPDHHHAPSAMRALLHGKHVFCEKPLCHDISQARALARAASAREVTTMMGNQGHCEEGYRRLREYLDAGAMGDVIETHSWSGFVNGGAGGRPASKTPPPGLHWDEWLGPAPRRDYHDGLHPLYWRYYWDFGTGGLGDWGCHNLDGVFWALEAGHPATIECLGTVGGSGEKYPQSSVIRWSVPARGGRPAFQAYWYDGAKPAGGTDPGARRGAITLPNYPPRLAEVQERGDWDFHEGFDGGTLYLGTKGVMHTGCYGRRPRLWPDAAHRAFPAPPTRLPRVQGSHFDHFLACCKAGEPTCADFGYAAGITEFLLLGHLAIKAGPGERLEWDPVNRRCRNRPDLDRWVARECRPGWELPAG